jgi:hypothetical protein
MTDELVVKASSAIARPNFIPVGDRTGVEHITKQDVKLPRLLVAQGLSPEVQEGEASYIEGLKVGMLFNDLTKEIYGKGPIEFWVVRADPPHWVEFIPRSLGGGIKDPNVPFGDPRTLPTPDGKDPVATQFYDFVIQFQPSSEVIALSLKGKAGVRAAKSLNGLIFLRDAPLHAGSYILTAGMAKSPKGTFAVYLFKNNGWAKSEEELKARAKLYESFKDKELNIDRESDETETDEGDGTGDTSFDTSKM